MPEFFNIAEVACSYQNNLCVCNNSNKALSGNSRKFIHLTGNQGNFTKKWEVNTSLHRVNNKMEIVVEEEILAK